MWCRCTSDRPSCHDESRPDAGVGFSDRKKRDGQYRRDHSRTRPPPAVRTHIRSRLVAHPSWARARSRVARHAFTLTSRSSEPAEPGIATSRRAGGGLLRGFPCLHRSVSGVSDSTCVFRARAETRSTSRRKPSWAPTLPRKTRGDEGHPGSRDASGGELTPERYRFEAVGTHREVAGDRDSLHATIEVAQREIDRPEVRGSSGCPRTRGCRSPTGIER